jgi:hypothetical protein
VLLLRLYVLCRRCGEKFLIQSSAKVRSDLPYSFELTCSRGHREICDNYEVVAEIELNKGTAGAIIGGVLGAIIAGPIGALGGAIIFGGAGASADNKERKAVERFNTS